MRCTCDPEGDPIQPPSTDPNCPLHGYCEDCGLPECGCPPLVLPEPLEGPGGAWGDPRGY